MLRRTLLRALERKGHRPVMAKARGVHRPVAPAATIPSGREAIFDEDELDPAYGVGRARPPTAARQQQTMTMSRRGHVAHSGAPPAASRAAINRVFEVDEAVEDDDDAPDGLEMMQRGATRRTTGRGTHPAEEEDDDAYYEEGNDNELDDGDHRGGDYSSGGHRNSPAAHDPAAAVAGELPPAADPGAQESKEAYRFLLDHIDAEIAALQRRHEAVTTRRQTVEERTASRVKELFEFMESPWLLLPTEVQPPLPATGVDVYLKEQRMKKGSADANKHNSRADPNDKMFVLACHKNYRGLPIAERRFYEQAAKHNAAVRQQLKYRLASGCARFETFCEQVKECTAEMARTRQMPELPDAAHPHSGDNGAGRYQGLSRWQRNARLAQQQAAASSAGHPSRQQVHADNDDDDDDEVDGLEEEEEAAPARRRGRVNAAGRKPKPAAKQIKKAAASRGRKKGGAKAADATEDVEDEEVEVVRLENLKAGKKAAKKPKAKPKAKPKKAAAAPRPAAKGGKKAKPAASAAPSTKATRSVSIPLPDIKKLVHKRQGKSATAAATTKAKKPAAKKAGGKKKKK